MARSAAASRTPVLPAAATTTPRGRDAAQAPANVTVLPSALPRRLAVVILPCPEESFASWVDRFAASCNLPPGLAAIELGLELRGPYTSDVRPVFYGVALSARNRDRVVAATGLSPDLVEDMHMSRYDGTALDLRKVDLADETSVRRVARHEWLSLHGSRACPHCLADTPAWPAWWRLGIAAVCPTHRVLLLDVCPRCGVGLRRGYVGNHPRGLSRVVVVDPAVCGNHTRNGRCAQPLATMPATPVDEHLVAAQQVALHAAGGHRVQIAGQAVEPGEWFQAVKYIAAMIRFTGAVTGPPRHASRNTRTWMDAFACEYQQRRRAGSTVAGSLRAVPSSAEQAAGLLAVIHTLFDTEDLRVCAQRITPLVEAMTATRRRLKRHNPLRHVRAPEPLGTLLSKIAPPPSRVAGVAPTVPDTHGVQIRHVPQQLDLADYRELVAAHLPGTADPSGRRLAALAVARLAGATSWADAGRLLDMDRHKAARASDAILRRIPDAEAFWISIREAAHRLARRPLVDFAARRAALADLIEVPAEVLIVGCRPLGFPVTPQRCGHAAAWIWAEFTSGDVRDAPTYTGHWIGSATPESVREGTRRFAAWLPDPVAADLRRLGPDLLREKGTT